MTPLPDDGHDPAPQTAPATSPPPAPATTPVARHGARHRARRPGPPTMERVRDFVLGYPDRPDADEDPARAPR